MTASFIPRPPPSSMLERVVPVMAVARPVPDNIATHAGIVVNMADEIGQTGKRHAELALVSGRIRTPAHPSGFVQAMAADGGVIRALGSDAEIRDHIGPHTRVINLR